VAAAFQEHGEPGHQFPAVAVQSRFCCLGDGRPRVRAFAFQPGGGVGEQPVAVVARQGPAQRVPAQLEEGAAHHPPVGFVDQGQPAACQALAGGAAVGVVFFRDQPFPGEAAGQVVEPVGGVPCSVDPGHVEHLRVDQWVDQVGGERAGIVGECSGGPAGDGRPVDEAEQPEDAGAARVEPVVGQGQAGPHGHVAVFEFVEVVAFVGEPHDHGGEGPVRAGGETGRHDPQGERQPSHGADEGPGGFGFGVDPLRAHDPGEEFQGLVAAEDVEFHQGGSGDAGEPGAGGDDDSAAAAAGDEREDLAFGDGVVEDDEDAAGGEQPAVHCGPLVGVVGDGLTGDAEGAQEPAEDVGGRERGAAAGPQVAVELAVRVVVGGELVGGVHGGGAFADAGPAQQDSDADGAVAVQQGRPDGFKGFGAAHEVGGVGGELVGGDAAGGGG